MVKSGLIIPTCLILYAIAWAFADSQKVSTLFGRVIRSAPILPQSAWVLLGITAFTFPVLEYWITAQSHGNALAGYIPWADATEYFHCAETHLLGTQSPPHCGKRPFYIAFLTGLLWLTGNSLQLALLLQSAILGGATVVLAREVFRTLNAPAALSAYAVIFVFAAALCSGLAMTENIGLVLGTLALALLWRYAHDGPPPLLFVGVCVLAAALSARPGALFVLPALLLWIVLYGKGSLLNRFALAAAAGLIAASAMALMASPILIAGGTLGSTHSNFSYSVYGLVVGGKGWLQVAIDHPEIFEQDSPKGLTDKVYQLALESFREKPHLFVLGYIKGVAKYFDALFRYATDFKPLRLALLLVPWALGVWASLWRWREPPCALLLMVQAGIILSSPFLIYDAHSRAFASTVAVDALFVALGMVWIGDRLAPRNSSRTQVPAEGSGLGFAVYAGLAALLVPLALFAIARPVQAPEGFTPPACGPGEEAVVIVPGSATLVLPLVAQGESSLFPLSVRADHFSSRLHRWVHAKDELRLPAGSNLVYGARLDNGSLGQQTLFVWKGEMPARGKPVGFCVKKGQDLGTFIGRAVSMTPMS